MKRIKAIVIFILCIFVFSACSSKLGRGDAPFSIENIHSIHLSSVNPNSEPALVPKEDMDEMCQWLDSFTIGKKVRTNHLEPGANSLRVRIEYNDGTIVESGIDAIRIGNRLRFIKRDPLPDCWSKIMIYN